MTTFPAPDTPLTQILVVSDPARSKAWYTDVLGVEAGEGRPSRWNTLRAMRVLDWSGLRA